MSGWQPDRYLAFGDLRLRPGLDLLARVPLDAPRTVVDLGFGPGNLSALLAARWPGAKLVGVDRAPAMLERARAAVPAGDFVEADIACWQGSAEIDVLFSNAALHWVDDHPALIARLAAMLSADGVLAVQMPANFSASSHRLLRELAAEPVWRERLQGARMGEVLDMAEYLAVLHPRFAKVDAWETTYWQRLEGRAPVLDWLRGTTLVPYLAALSATEGERFTAELGCRLDAAYPRQADGSVLFPFRRLFFVASGPRL